MFTKGIDGTSGTSYQMSVKVIQEASDSVIAKIAKDTGFGTSAITPLTGLMDFNVTIPDASDYGKIVSLSWVLPEGTKNPKYLKRDQASGEYFDFAYDATSGEGAKWDASSSTLTVYIRDNGRYDADPTAGIVRDPGLPISAADESDTTAANITGPSGSAGDSTSSKSIAENTTAVHTFTASESVDWSINGGADASSFSINPDTGALAFATAQDYEIPTDTGTDNTYVVVVQASDASENISQQTVTVTVTDVDDTAPVITGPTGGAGSSTSTTTVNENLTAVHTCSSDDTSATWDLNGGADASSFSITSAGVLTFQSAPNFESPSDANTSNDYVVIVRASDGTNTSEQTVTVNIANVLESGDGDSSFSTSIDENTTAVYDFDVAESDTLSLIHI